MPSAAARRLYEDQIPSFMSVFDLGAEAMDDQNTVTVVDPKIIGLSGPNFDGKLPSTNNQPHYSALQPANGAAAAVPLDPAHRHHDSTSTQASESADSSPTTTMSCTDSSSLSDPSPSSSPDSPVNLVPLAAFPGPSFGPLPTLSSTGGGLSSSGVSSGMSSGGLSADSPSDPPSGLPPLSSAMSSLSVKDVNQPQPRPVTSPSPRRRNMKGLSIQPPFVSPTLSSTLVSEPSSPSFIKPQIPAMKRKPSQLSLKTSTHDLIKATTLDVPQSPALSIPPILQRRALKHSTSSPHMLSSLKSSTFGPPGGMTIPTVLERNESGLSEFLRPSRPSRPGGFDSTILEEESPIRTQIANRAAFEFEPYHEHENNEDQKSPGYPDGPIAIYGDNVFLYLEPTAEEASRFDVVFNVAREVRNPFKTTTAPSMPSSEPSVPQQQQQPAKSRPGPLLMPKLQPVLEPISDEPESACPSTTEEPALQTQPTAQAPILPTFQFAEHKEESCTVEKMELLPAGPGIPPSPIDQPEIKTTFTPPDNFPPPPPAPSTTQPSLPSLSLSTATSAPEASIDESTPTTPKASVSLKEPEYIHIPWDHNTDIGEDLMMLCETIEKKTKEGKKVLIHCQQGASRSASLIIAYGMYQNPELTVNDAYYAAQAKSKWISPNMRLMYCLQDFQKEVSKKKAPPALAALSQPRPGRSPTKHRATLSADAIEVSPKKEPLSAPLPPDENSNGSNGTNSRKSLSPDGSPMTRPRGNSSPSSREAVSPGPSSAPSSLSWSEKEDEEDTQKFGRFPDVPTIMRPPPSAGKVSRSPSGSESASGSGSGFGLRPDSGFGSASGSSSLGSLGASLGSLDSLMKPPPSPGFAAHRFGEFPTGPSGPNGFSGAPRAPAPSGLPGLGGNSNSSMNRINHINTTFNNRVAPLSISSFALFSPGLPPPTSANGTGLDSILTHNMEPAPVLDHGIDVAMSDIGSTEPATTDASTKDDIHEQTVPIRHAFPLEDTLMSPRAEKMTNNPLHDAMGDMAGMNFVEEPQAPSDEPELFSPRQSVFPRNPFLPFGRPTQVADPRSPPTKGETPIVRSIDDLI